MENNEIRLPETLMDKTERYTLSGEERNKLAKQAMSLLQDYNYNVKESAVMEIIREWEEKKGWIVNLFSQHPKYNGNFQIVLPSELRRPIDMDGIQTFIDWSITELKKSFKEIRIGMFAIDEYERMRSRIYHLATSLSEIGRSATYMGHTAQYYVDEYNRMGKVLSERRDKYSDGWESVTVGMKTKYISKSDYRIYKAVSRIMDKLLGNCRLKEEPNIITAADCDNISRWTDIIDVKPAVGQRVVKYIRKILVKYGLDHIVNIQKKGWFDDSGNYHVREMDMGYNHYMALLGDSINPLNVSTEVVLSVNPIDYWTMSFGYNWASCHTIDKENTRGNGSDNYHGCYSSGTESYMLDSSSFIVYSRPNAEQLSRNGEQNLPMELQSKVKRCVFMMGEDKLIQSRLYPDGRDGGDEGLAAQFRKIVQTIIADLYHTSNLWTLKTGTYECTSVIHSVSGSTHYKDYAHYDDCNVSYLRRVDGLLNTKNIAVGAKPICPSCGERHNDEEWITCCDCRTEKYCDNCGCYVENGDYECIETDDGHIYCCSDCAERAGYVNTVDDGWHYRDDCMYEDYSDEWYYYDREGISVDDDDIWFHNADAAESAGYVYCDIDDRWILLDDALEIGDSGEYFIPDRHDYIETDNGLYFPDPTSAIENGYTQLEDGTWTDEITADGEVAV